MSIDNINKKKFLDECREKSERSHEEVMRNIEILVRLISRMPDDAPDWIQKIDKLLEKHRNDCLANKENEARLEQDRTRQIIKQDKERNGGGE